VFVQINEQFFFVLRASGWTVDEGKKAEVLGYKLSLGLELLLSRNRSSADPSSSPGAGGPAWANFLARLATLGYFQGELEGSVRYRELAARAAQYWTSGEEEEGGRHGRLDRLVSLVGRLEEGGGELSAGGWLRPAPARDEDESWMEVTPESLDK
jgi:hypothetical protein